MPIDASIALGVKPVQIEDSSNALARLLQVQGAQQANQLHTLQMEKYQRENSQQNALADLYKNAYSADGKLDRSALLRGAASGGLGARIPELQKGFAAEDKATAETEKAKLESHLKNFEVAGQIMSGVKDQASWDAARAQTAQLFGQEAAARLPAQYDPALVEQNRIKAMSVKDQMEQQYKALTQAETARHNSASEKLTASGQQITMRGQNMVDARARETLDAGKTQIVQSDNGPVLVNMRSGAGRVVNGPDGQPLPGVTKPLNDGQSKALLFGSRMREADKILGQLATEGTSASIPGSRAPVIGGVITALSSGNQQMLDQAKRDFMTAVLRRESGAAISSGEFETADQQYFPQVGDSEKVKAQKSANRHLAIKGVLVEVPEKQRNSLQPAAAPAAAPAPNIDALLDKYK